MIARFEIHTDDRVRVETEIDRQYFQTHIIVVHLVITESYIDVDSMEVFILDQELLVDLSGFLKVRAQIVQGSHAKLVFNRAAQSRMQVHDFVLISELLGQLEQKTHFERTVFEALFGFSLSFLVLSSRVETAGLVYIDLLVLLATLDQFIVDLHSLPKFRAKHTHII